MNTTTLNMTTLDGGVIIKRGDGGGATINNQDKVVDITENGTTEVVADGGFTGLGKVTINTEVSGGESGGSNWRYFDVTSYNDTQKASVLSQYAMIASLGGEFASMVGVAKLILGASFALQSPSDVSAIAYDANAMAGGVGMLMTMQQLIESSPYWEEIQKNEITKEQFYSLD